MVSQDLRTILSSIADGRVRDFRFRQRQFHSLHRWIVKHSSEIQVAAQKDDHLSEIQSRFLVASVLSDLRTKYNSLDLKKELYEEYNVKHGRDHINRKVPEDLVYLVPDTYTLFVGVIGIICACLSSGSCCIVELSTDLKHSSNLLRQCFRDALDKTTFTIISESPSEDVMERCLVIDQIRSKIDSSAGRTLICQREAWTAIIVDRTADLDHTAREIVHAKSFGSAQSPYSPTCVLVNEFVEEELTKLLHKYSEQVKAMSPNHTTNGSANGHINQKSIKVSPKSDDSQLVLKVKNIHLVKVTERSDINIRSNKDTALMPLLSVSSYDDAIDVLGTNPQTRLLALYVFAEPLGAKYLTQFVHSQVAFINHIPANVLVGPAAPIEYPVSTIERYRREMLEKPSPVLVHPARGTFAATEIIQQNNTSVSTFYKRSLDPLEPMGQAKEGDMNFFVLGIYTGFAFVVVPLLLGTAVAGGYGLYKLYKQIT